MDNYYVYKKEVDWSLLNQGFSIPLDIQVIFQNNIRKFISRGESRDVYFVLDGVTYKVKLVNQKFDESKYPNHKDLLQIRYDANIELIEKLRSEFLSTYSYLCEQRNSFIQNNKHDRRKKVYFKIPEDKKEYLTLYTTEYEDTYLAECITRSETAEAKDFLLSEDEQSYEASINYPSIAQIDQAASIATIQRLVKIRKISRAIGDSLKLLYEYRCQICGSDFGERYCAHIVESHHIDPFVVSMNNDAVNQIIVCPNHHRVIHKAGPHFDRSRRVYIYPNRAEEKLLLNRHL